MKISSMLDKINFLGKINPKIFDIIPKHDIKISDAMREYMAATVVREIALQVGDKRMEAELLSAGKEMVGFASKGLINGWEEGDDICPPWPFPFPFPYPQPEPDPIPWRVAEKFEGLAFGLKALAGLTAIPKVAEQLHGMSIRLAEMHLPQAQVAIIRKFEWGNLDLVAKTVVSDIKLKSRIKDILDGGGKSFVKDHRDDIRKRLKDAKDSREYIKPEIPEWEWPMEQVGLAEKLASLEAQVEKVSIFIQQLERPDVGAAKGKNK